MRQTETNKFLVLKEIVKSSEIENPGSFISGARYSNADGWRSPGYLKI